MIELDDVARMALAMPEATEGLRHGNRTWFVGAKGFAWERPFSKADIRRFGDARPPEGAIVAVRVADLDDKDALLATEPKGFFTIPHFDGYAAVLIQLKTARRRDVHEAVTDAWLACAAARVAKRYLDADGPAQPTP